MIHDSSEEKSISSRNTEKYNNDNSFYDKSQNDSSDSNSRFNSEASGFCSGRDEYSSDSCSRYNMELSSSFSGRNLGRKHNDGTIDSKVIPQCLLNSNFIGKNASIDFTQTVAYFRIKQFIFEINNSVKNENQTEYVDDLVIKVDEIINNTSLSDEPARFANAAMKSVIDKICLLTNDKYFQESFGNKIRMDFGTGHEMNFLCYLYEKTMRNEIKLCNVFSVLKKYFRVIRKYLQKYNVEAAGARGCWSIDDYQLLPYLFGSAENFELRRSITTIFEGAFYEAWSFRRPTELLKSICTMDWPFINNRLIDMYDKEVFNKKVVTQHFIYSKYLPDTYQDDESS